MEWMLQVVDEIDDAIGTMRHRWSGFQAEMGMLTGGAAVLAALCVAVGSAF